MSNFSEDEKTKIILLENALKERNKTIKKLYEQLDRQDKLYLLLKRETDRLKRENQSLIDTLKQCQGV